MAGDNRMCCGLHRDSLFCPACGKQLPNGILPELPNGVCTLVASCLRGELSQCLDVAHEESAFWMDKTEFRPSPLGHRTTFHLSLDLNGDGQLVLTVWVRRLNDPDVGKNDYIFDLPPLIKAVVFPPEQAQPHDANMAQSSPE